MARLAFCREGMEICEMEGKRSGKSYTYFTVAELKKKFPNEELIMILGGDSLRDFHKWVKPDEILKHCTLAVLERVGTESEGIFAEQEKRFGISILRLKGKAPKVSSTEVRVRLAFGEDVSNEVPAPVLRYIREKGLYGEYGEMTAKLKSYLTENRYLHTMRVAQKALELNRQLDLEESRVMTAAILHDCAKYLTRADWSRYGFQNKANYPESVVHAFLGAAVAKQDFRVKDAEILDAIRYHTTGRPRMSRLEQLIYMADSIEDGRENADALRQTAERDFEQGFRECLQSNYRYTLRHHSTVSPLTEECLNYYLGETYEQ